MSKFIPWFLGEKPKPKNWDDIYSEYISLRENKNSQFILGLIKEISILETKGYIVQKICEFLSIPKYDRDIVNELRKLGYKQKLDFSKKEKFMLDVKAIISLNKKTLDQAARKQRELDAFKNKHGVGEMNWKSFISDAVIIGKYMGFQIKFNEVSVAYWCEMLNEYDRYQEVANGINNNLLNKEASGRR